MSERESAPAHPRRVLIADDHAATRAGVRAALEQGGFAVCAEAADGPAAVVAALRERPDACLLDVSMPGGDGIPAAAEIAARLPGTAIVMLTVSADEEDLFAAIKAGAVGYLLKDVDPARLPFALDGVLAGEAAIPRRLVGRIVAELGERRRRRVPLARGAAELTPREWEVLELLHAGASTAEVAARTGVSDVTVRRHVSAALHKLRVPDRGAAFALLDRMREHAGARVRSRV
ncbi:MAG TPA: response regulator transcription factor [Conexibacter sp.]|nr:response regulator transcription factor [Conexibacter sp.]